METFLCVSSKGTTQYVDLNLTDCCSRLIVNTLRLQTNSQIHVPWTSNIDSASKVRPHPLITKNTYTVPLKSISARAEASRKTDRQMDVTKRIISIARRLVNIDDILYGGVSSVPSLPSKLYQIVEWVQYTTWKSATTCLSHYQYTARIHTCFCIVVVSSKISCGSEHFHIYGQ